MTYNENNLIWIDLEMTGLDPDNNRIIEMATIITTFNLEIIEESPVFAIHQCDELLNNMDAWNKEHHTNSGLLKRVKQSTITETQAESEMIAFLEKYVPAGKSPMCGNSICLDRRFLYRYMRKLEQFFHYRNLDVSTLKMLAQLWAPQVAKKLVKESQHLAQQDIRDSIEELKYYREHFIKNTSV